MNDPRLPLRTDALASQNANVVLLVNFVAPNMIAVCQEIGKRVGRLTILTSVAMESNRNWQSDWGDMDVRVQKTFTITRRPKHPSGYREFNYIHLPIDTLGQLRRFRPDVIVSLEMGARTALSSIYRSMNRSCVHVMAVNASERTEAGRGTLRQITRRRLSRRVDWITYNGPSCKRLVTSLGADPDRLSPWDYASDPRKPYDGDLKPISDRGRLRMVTVGQLSERKGMLLALQQLAQWCRSHAGVSVRWDVVGDGPLEEAMRKQALPDNLGLKLHGHCDSDAIRNHYRDSDVMFFPTLGDEWGLVVDEAFLSGLPVIGSCHSQAVTTLVRDGESGIVYDPEVSDSLSRALNRWMDLPQEDYEQMPRAARAAISSRTPATSAEQLVRAIDLAIAVRRTPPGERSGSAEAGSRVAAR